MSLLNRCRRFSALATLEAFAASLLVGGSRSRRGYRTARIIVPAICALALFASGSLQAQVYSGGRNARPLISQPIDESKLISLPGNTHPAATLANDRGAVPDTLPLEHLQLQLQRPAELEQKLEKLIADQQRQGSPVYHHWLTAEQFGQRFGVSPQDVQRITNWLESHGFQVNGVFTSGMVIEFSGNAGQIKAAFHTEIHNLEVDGEPHIANVTDPKIPAALAGVIKGVTSLHDFKPHSMLKKRPDFTLICPASVCGTQITFYAVVPAT